MKYPKILPDYLEASANRVPAEIAFADEREEVSFSELRNRAKAIGSALSEVAQGSPVAVIVERSAAALCGFMGVLYAGCFYVPIDPNMPEVRLKSILDTVHPAAVLYETGREAVAEKCASVRILISEAAKSGCDEDFLKQRRTQTLDTDAAYCIFTSGSTGVPKGIAVSHRSVIDFTEWYTETCDIRATDIMGNLAPFYFDLSVKDIYATLKTGAKTYILPKKLAMFPVLLIKFLKEKQVTVISWATGAMHLVANSGVLSEYSADSLRTVITGGEALQAKQVNIWKAAMPQLRFINLYGPTEVTVDCAYYILDRDFADEEAIPIGKACENMEIILLDEALNPVKNGEKGEICVRGSGLALGYYNDWQKTEASFIQNPLNPHFPERLYRTGDMGFFGEDGNLYFSARKDNQIKHMGYRIELGEIETALCGLTGINNAACFFDAAKDKIIAVCETELTEKEIVLALKQKLPKYMLPNHFRTVAKMPLNANGKTDRVLLKKEYEDGKNQ